MRLEPSPTRTLKLPGRNCVQITCSSTRYEGTAQLLSLTESSSSSSAFPAMLDIQSGEWGEVRTLPQCLNRSPKLPVGPHRTGPCLASQVIEGGAGLQSKYHLFELYFIS